VYRDGLLVQEKFFHTSPQQTWVAWIIDLVIKKPVSWTFNKVKDSVLNNTRVVSEDVPYVHIGACKVGGISESIHSTLKWL
jgi:hypothetical protein